MKTSTKLLNLQKPSWFLLALLLLFIGFKPAHAQTDTILRPYTANYTIKALGVSIAKSVHHLRTRQNNYILSSFTAGGLPFYKFELELKSYGHYSQGQVIPNKFIFRRKNGSRVRGWDLDIERREAIAKTFEHDSEKAGREIKREYAIPPLIQDEISQQLQMRLDLMQFDDIEDISYTTAERKAPETWHYQIVGEEKVSTGIGDLDTVVIQYESDDEESTLWLAKDLDYIIVRATYNATDNIQGIATLDSIEFFD